MAARGGPKLKEYRTAVTSVKQWQSEISFPQLSVVELFSSSFGNCQVILPTINSVMTNTPEAEKKVRWLTVNVAKLEEEQRLAEESEQKKEDEISGNTQRRPAASVSVAVIAPAPAASLPLPTIIDTQQQQAEHKQQTAQDAEDEEAEADGSQPASAVQPALDPSVPSLPLLEAWHGYDHPRPLWLFFLGGVLQYELTSANPPKMQRLVAACLSGEKLSVDELQGMELQTDSAEVAAEKRKARLLKKKQEEEAKRKAKEMEDAQQARKKREIVRTTPELLIHLALSSFTNVTSDSDEAAAAAAGGDRQPLLVLYWKDGDSDFYYHSQTLRTPPSASGSVQFPTAVVWKKPDSPEAAAHLDLRLALYESADDEPVKGDRDGVRLLGEGFVNFAALLAGDNSVRILHRDPSIPPLSPTAKSPRVAARVDRLMATALLTVKDRVSEGVLTDYRFAVSVNGLAAPSAPADGAAADSANSYTVSVSAIDDTTPVPLLLSTTEAASALPLVFSTPLSATHFSNLPRQLLFQLRTEGGAVINSAQVPLQSLLAKAGSTATLSTLDAAGEASGVELLLRVDEVDEDGNVVPTAAPALSEEERQRRDALHWMQAAFSVHSLPPALITQQPLLALYQQEPAGGSSLLGLSSPPAAAADSAADASAAPSFTRSFFLPLDTVLLPTYKAVLLSSPSASSTEGATVVGQHLFDLSVLEGGAKSSVELTLETAEGAAIDGSLLRLSVTDVGRQGLLNLRFAASGLPTLPRGAEHTQASAVLAVWIQQADGSRELLGRTERVSESASPVFARRFQCPAYSLGSASLAVRLYDASAEDDALPADADCIAELTGCRLSALLYGDELSLPLAALDGSALPDARITVVNESPIAKEATTDAAPEVQPAEQKAEAVQPRPTSKAASRPASKAASRPASKSGKKTAAAEAELKVAVTSRRPSEAGQAAEVTALALTFDAAGLQAEDGSATLTVYAVDDGQEEQLGTTEAAVAGGAAAFAVPITIIASATADRSLRIAVQSGGQSRGELRLTVSSLSRVVGAASSFPLTSADQQLLPSTLSVRVNAQAADPAAASFSSLLPPCGCAGHWRCARCRSGSSQRQVPASQDAVQLQAAAVQPHIQADCHSTHRSRRCCQANCRQQGAQPCSQCAVHSSPGSEGRGGCTACIEEDDS